MANVDVKVTMSSGIGLGLFIKIDEQTLYFNASGTKTINLIPQYYSALVSGNEPSTANVIIEFLENVNSLANQAFSTPTFWGFIPFTVI